MTESSSADPYPVTPVPGRARRDGWTPERQQRFLAALAKSGTVVAAARAVGMTPRSAYTLRRRAGEDSGFARCWDAGLERGCDDALAILTGRAIEGELVPIFRRGRQVGEYRRYDTSAAIAVLRVYVVRRGGMV